MVAGGPLRDDVRQGGKMAVPGMGHGLRDDVHAHRQSLGWPAAWLLSLFCYKGGVFVV